MSDSEIDILKRRIKREIAARKEAERILEEKALELYFKNKELNALNQNLEQEVLNRTKELRSSEEKYRGILENMELGLLEVDLDGRIIKAYDSFCKLLGYTNEELIGKDPVKLFLKPGDEQIISEQHLQRKKGQNGIYEIEMRKKDGNFIWVAISGAPFYNLDGDITGSIGIHLDITHLKRLQQNLIEAKEKAEKAQHTEKMFLAQMSHELRTPLNGVLGLSNILSETELNNEQKDLVRDLLGATKLLNGLINDILDLSRIRAGEIDATPDRINTLYEIEQIVRAIQNRKSEGANTIQIESQLDAGDYVYLNRGIFNHICVNLIGNADKFTQNGQINVRLKNSTSATSDQLLVIEVEDNGVGMSEKTIPTIFNTFKQAEDRTNSTQGTGLGLSIVKQLVDILEGNITVQSELGKGSTFTVTLPARFFEDVKKTDNDVLESEQADLSKLSVLIAEDNMYNQRYIMKLMERWQVNYELTKDGRECIDRLSAKKFDVCILDIHMPYLTGYEVLDMVKSDMGSVNYKTPFVALTAAALKEEKQKAFDMGFDSYISKPFQPSELLKELKNRMGQSAPTQVIKSPVKPKKITNENPFYHMGLNPLVRPNLLEDYFDSDLDYATSMLRLYLKTARIEVDKLKSSITDRDMEGIRSTLHKLKPSLLLSGRKDLHELSNSINEEIIAKNNPAESNLNKFMEHLEASFEVVQDTIDKIEKYASPNH